MAMVDGAALTPAIVDATIPPVASAGSSDDDEGSSSGDPDELTGGSGAVIAIAREPKVVGIGLDPADAILRSPRSKDPVIISRSNLTDVYGTEAVLTGGWLDEPTLLPDITIVKSKKFYRLQRASVPLRAFLTGKHPRTCPLKDVPVFSQMKERMQSHCNKLQKIAEDAINEQGVQHPTVDRAAVEKRVRLTRKQTCKLPAREAKPKRNHRKNQASRMLPSYDEVDMSCGIIPWSPIVLLRCGDANVLMEVTAANFEALFNSADTDRRSRRRKRFGDNAHASV